MTKSKVISICILSALIYEEKPAIPILDIPIDDISNIIIEIGNQLVDFKHYAMVHGYRFDLNLLLDNDLYSQTMPDNKQKKNIITTYNSTTKCSSMHYWTTWNSYTDLSSSKLGNDDETLDLHRKRDPR